MPFVGRALGWGTDARWLIAAGLLIMAIGNYWMSQMNLEISPGQVVWPRVMLVVGLSICFAPANVAPYLYTPPLLRGASVGLLSLLRQERRDRFHVLRLGEFLEQTLENVRQQQASSLAYFDVLLLAVVTPAMLPAVLLMTRSVAQKDAHIGHE